MLTLLDIHDGALGDAGFRRELFLCQLPLVAERADLGPIDSSHADYVSTALGLVKYQRWPWRRPHGQLEDYRAGYLRAKAAAMRAEGERAADETG